MPIYQVIVAREDPASTRVASVVVEAADVLEAEESARLLADSNMITDWRRHEDTVNPPAAIRRVTEMDWSSPEERRDASVRAQQAVQIRKRREAQGQ